MDDDGIMINIYDNVQDELKATNKLMKKEKEKVCDIGMYKHRFGLQRKLDGNQIL